MSTTGHENEAINVQGLKASLQKFKTDHVDGKAAKATTLQGYGITDAYTKNETYTKTEVNGLVSTPHQEYVTVATYASLPASGSADTIYRVSSYDGANSQVDDTVYSEYAWDGTQYVFLDVKSQIGEVFDITVYNSNTKYANLSAALGVDGANIPQSLRRGGMSVKYVQSSDNKYVQFRLMSDTFNTTVANWQGVDNKPIFNSNDLITSGGVYDYLNNVLHPTNKTTGVKLLTDGTTPEKSDGLVYTYNIEGLVSVAITGRQGAGNTDALACFFDSSNNLIDYYQGNLGTNYSNYWIEVPYNARYIKVCNSSTNMFNYIGCIGSGSIKEQEFIKHHPFDYLKMGGEALNGCSFDYESGYKKLIIPAGVTNTSSYIGYYLDKARVNVESTYFVSVAVKRSKNAPKKDTLSLTSYNASADKTQTFIKTVEYDDYAVDYYYAKISNIILGATNSRQWISIQGFNNTTENDWWYAIDIVVRSSLGVYQNEISELQDDLQQTKSDLTDIQDFMDFKKVSVVAYNGSSPVQEYFRNKYVVYNEPFEKNCRLTKLSLNVYQWYINSNAVLYIYVGTLLQAHDTGTVGEWFLDVREYAIELSKVTYTIPSTDLLVISDFGDYEINIDKNECIGFLSQNNEYNPCIVIQYSNETSDDKVYICDTLEGTFVKANHNIRRLTFDVTENNLVSHDEIDNLDKRIDLVNEEISQIEVITDRTTSQKYILVVNNGVLGLKSLIYSKAAIIGSSCVVHPYAADINYFRIGGGSMVPSISEYTWENFTLKALRQQNNQATISKASCAAWERNLYTVVRDENNNIIGYTENQSDYSFINIIENNTDFVIMQLLGNTAITFGSDTTKELLIQTLRNKTIELLENVHTLSQNTDIYITDVTNNSIKVEALLRAANELNYVHYVYINGWTENGFKWAIGDYYAEDNDALGTLYPITHSGVAIHGNDYFFYNATKLMMKAAGYDFSYPTYTITLNQVSGGSISTPNTTWFENSVVNIRCNADSGKSISSVSVKNESGTDISLLVGLTQRTNDYGVWYTFKMPAYNVTVTPIWE